MHGTATGLELAAMDAAITAADATHARTVEESQEALTDAGHWGMPTIVLDGEPFFGDARIDTLRRQLGQRRSSRGQRSRVACVTV